MKPKSGNVNSVSDIMSRVSVEKNKIIIAAVLITIMLFMWLRVFIKDKSTVQKASAGVTQNVQQGVQEPLEVSYISLPVVSGRNDVLTRDVFSNQSSFGGSSGFNNASEDDLNDAWIRRIAKEMKIEAVIMGRNRQAFINNKFVSVGSTIHVESDDRIYEFAVTEIYEDRVVVKWKAMEITLRMSQL